MRISDWSSDVCSSDLPILGEVEYDGLAGHRMREDRKPALAWPEPVPQVGRQVGAGDLGKEIALDPVDARPVERGGQARTPAEAASRLDLVEQRNLRNQPHAPQDRRSAVEVQRVSVRLAHGVPRALQQNNKK